MNKSQAYKALAMHQLTHGSIDNVSITTWLMNNDPVTLCKAIGLYTAPVVKRVTKFVPDYIHIVNAHIDANEYVSAIKYVRTNFGWD